MSTTEIPLEPVVEAVENAPEVIEEVSRAITGREAGFFFLGIGIGVAAGFSLGYKMFEKRISEKYDKMAADAIEEMREHYHRKIVAAEPKPPIQEAVAPRKADEIIEKERYSQREVEVIDEVNEKYPADSVDDWNYDEELKKRTPHEPYVIHIDEFMQNEHDHEQTELQYYDEDGVVADQHDQTVPVETVGEKNLKRFGDGSQNQYTVYIRNEQLELDIELQLVEGSYTESVHGIIKHSSERREKRILRRRRFDDDEAN